MAQLINHFARNGNLTTKVGLTRNLRNLKWFEDVDMDQFFPRSYALGVREGGREGAREGARGWVHGWVWMDLCSPHPTSASNYSMTTPYLYSLPSPLGPHP